MSAVSPLRHPVIRALAPEDLDRVVEIEQACYPFPWTRGIFADCLRAGYVCVGLQSGSRLAGYSVMNWAAGEAHLLNLCVHPEFQRLGYGRLLLDQALAQARARGCHAMFLEVRPSNQRAGRLYARAGFRPVGERPAYYPAHEGREDAVVMRLDL
jgi:ribosomal-protein-alanine N-acetyltransferase